MRSSLLSRLLPNKANKNKSFIRSLVTGSLFKLSDIRGNTSLADIKTQIDTMRALARDSQINTALSYYATDATTTNTSGQIIWATADDKNDAEVADIINTLFERWEINKYARDHILELATIGNLYIPTTRFYAESSSGKSQQKVALDNNTIPDDQYDIVPSTKLMPEEVLHLWKRGKASGYIYKPEDDTTQCIMYPEEAIIHFSLGGLLGEYVIEAKNRTSGQIDSYDIQFAQPLMEKAVQPTQTLSLLEDALILSSLTRIVKFINVECGNAEEDEIADTLQNIKDTIEQQFAMNTNTGEAQSFVNPQSPNNLIYLARVNGQDAISITDLNMAEANEQDNKLLTYYQDKKLSVLGVPKEAMNFSSNEGLGGAGSVLSQRSALYANSLSRLETAYMAGWKSAIDHYFKSRNMSGFIGKYTLHMNPIITTQSTITFEKRDAALNQANTLVTLLKDLGVDTEGEYKEALTEILSEVFPQIGSAVANWGVNVTDTSEGGDDGGF